MRQRTWRARRKNSSMICSTFGEGHRRGTSPKSWRKYPTFVRNIRIPCKNNSNNTKHSSPNEIYFHVTPKNVEIRLDWVVAGEEAIRDDAPVIPNMIQYIFCSGSFTSRADAMCNKPNFSGWHLTSYFIYEWLEEISCASRMGTVP